MQCEEDVYEGYWVPDTWKHLSGFNYILLAAFKRHLTFGPRRFIALQEGTITWNHPGTVESCPSPLVGEHRNCSPAVSKGSPIDHSWLKGWKCDCTSCLTSCILGQGDKPCRLDIPCALTMMAELYANWKSATAHLGGCNSHTCCVSTISLRVESVSLLLGLPWWVFCTARWI